MSGRQAAEIAEKAASGGNKTYTTLSAMMCWEAVVHCQTLAGKPKSGLMANSVSVISRMDIQVNNKADMLRIPPGSYIGFFDGARLAHAMLAVGGGRAAGVKNSCIGIGGPYGWEILDLANGLNWNNNGFNDGHRNLTVHYKTYS